MRRKKNLVLLGMPNAGKSSYIQLAICFVNRHCSSLIQLGEGNPAFGAVLNCVEGNMQQGKWPEKTLDAAVLQFSVKWKHFFINRSMDIQIHDYAGERTEAFLSNPPEPSVAKTWKQEVLGVCLESDCIFFFVDGNKLKDAEEIIKIQECLDGLQQGLGEKTKALKWAFLVTKADMLANVPSFQTNGAFDAGKVAGYLWDKLPAFMGNLNFHASQCAIFCVSHLRRPKHFVWEPERGPVPNQEWNLGDMAGEIEPLNWAFKHLSSWCGL